MQQRFLLQNLLLARHVSGTTMPIIRSSRVLYSGCCRWYFVLWFSSCWSGVELRVICPVCRMLAGLNQQASCRPLYNTLELLMMGIVVPEPCREKIKSAIKTSVASSWHFISTDSVPSSQRTRCASFRNITGQCCIGKQLDKMLSICNTKLDFKAFLKVTNRHRSAFRSLFHCLIHVSSFTSSLCFSLTLFVMSCLSMMVSVGKHSFFAAQVNYGVLRTNKIGNMRMTKQCDAFA